jgi:ABC-type enterochelin transport system permease subunit
VGVLFIGLAGTVFVFLLAIKVYSTVVGVLLGFLALIPFIGLLVLLIVNGKATRTLKQKGIAVGLLGADLSQI